MKTDSQTFFHVSGVDGVCDVGQTNIMKGGARNRLRPRIAPAPSIIVAISKSFPV